MVNANRSPNSIALVTGASRGLGRSTALHLAQKGVDLIVTYRSNRIEADAVVAQITAQGRKAVALALDTADIPSFGRFTQTVRTSLAANFGRDNIDFLVNNAGAGHFAPFESTTEQAFDQMFNVNLKGVYFLTQNLLPLIADGGRIVNLSSGLARFTNPGMSAYAVMKGGVEVLTRYLAKELGPRRIAVNTVAPGAIETDFGGGTVRDDVDVNRHIAAATALGRVGRPDDIGALISALLSADHRWVNGQRIEASGGIFL